MSKSSFLQDNTQYIDTENSFSLERLAKLMGINHKDIYSQLEGFAECNKDIIVNIQPMEDGEGGTYYVVFVPHEPIDFDHWESVEKLFKQYDYTANWVGEDDKRPVSQHIRWVEDIDDEIPSLYQSIIFDSIDDALSANNLKRKLI